MARKRIASRLHLLSVRQVQTAGDGDHADGGGLRLRVRGDSVTWVFRFTAPSGQRREMGLGSAERSNPTVAGKSLTDAREKAYNARSMLSKGADPIDERETRRQAQREAATRRKMEAHRNAMTLARVARDYHERVIEPARSRKHGADWINSLENHLPPKIWHAPIATIEPVDLLDVMAGLQAKIPETASRIRQRLEAIFDDAIFRRHCSTNPATAVRRKLREIAVGRGKRNLRALPFKDAPDFMKQLRHREGIAARALEFAMLTAARTGEVLGATWAEFDLNAAIWSVAAERMKAGEPHVVFLSRQALQLVQTVRAWGKPFVFPSPTIDGKALSNMGMLTLLRRMDVAAETTVHGLRRATFSTWANESGAARPDVIEACLAHRESDRIRAAYNRAQFAAERRALLCAWAEFLDGQEGVRQERVLDVHRQPAGAGDVHAGRPDAQRDGRSHVRPQSVHGRHQHCAQQSALAVDRRARIRDRAG
jgi:integrase